MYHRISYGNSHEIYTRFTIVIPKRAKDSHFHRNSCENSHSHGNSGDTVTEKMDFGISSANHNICSVVKFGLENIFQKL